MPLQASGAPAQKVSLATVDREGIEVDVTVATEPLAPGDIALAVPEHLIVSRWWLAVAVRGVAGAAAAMAAAAAAAAAILTAGACAAAALIPTAAAVCKCCATAWPPA